MYVPTTSSSFAYSKLSLSTVAVKPLFSLELICSLLDLIGSSKKAAKHEVCKIILNAKDAGTLTRPETDVDVSITV